LNLIAIVKRVYLFSVSSVTERSNPSAEFASHLVESITAGKLGIYIDMSTRFLLILFTSGADLRKMGPCLLGSSTLQVSMLAIEPFPEDASDFLDQFIYFQRNNWKLKNFADQTKNNKKVVHTDAIGVGKTK
jgi:hypothetical protein